MTTQCVATSSHLEKSGVQRTRRAQGRLGRFLMESFEPRRLLSVAGVPDGTYKVTEWWKMTITNTYEDVPHVIKRSGQVSGTIHVTNGAFTLVNKSGVGNMGDLSADISYDGFGYTVTSDSVLRGFGQGGPNLYAFAKIGFFAIHIQLPDTFGWSLFQNNDTYTMYGGSPGSLSGGATALDANEELFDFHSSATLKQVGGSATPTPKLSLAAQPGGITAGDTLGGVNGLTVNVLDANGNINANDSSNVTIALIAANGATLGGTTTVQAINGVATFPDLTIGMAGKFKLLITDPEDALPSLTTSAFTVSPDTATAQLMLVQTPVQTLVGKALSPMLKVQVVDQFNNLIPANGIPITLSVISGPGEQVFTGPITVATKKGVAVFKKTAITTAGDYDLAVSSPDLVNGSQVSFSQVIGMATSTAKTPHAAKSYAFGKTIQLGTQLKSDAPRSIPFTGLVDVFDEVGRLIGAVPVGANGSVKVNIPTLNGTQLNLSAGSHLCTLAYEGDLNHTGYTTGTFTLVVKPAATKVVLQASTLQLTVGDSLDLTATIGSGAVPSFAPTGMVTFLDNGSAVGSVTLTGGVATLHLMPTAGQHKFLVTYAGDTNFLASQTALKPLVSVT